MAITVILLGLVLFAAGGGALIASVDLLPTELGMLYAGCGAVAMSSAFIVFALAAVIRTPRNIASAGRARTRVDGRRGRPAARRPARDLGVREHETGVRGVERGGEDHPQDGAVVGE